jgi:hypothetical protein
LAESVCSSDEINGWSLVWVGREKDRAERIPKGFNTARKIQIHQDVKLSFVHTHVVMIIKINKTSVKGAVIGGRKSDSVPDLVDTPRGAHWKNVSSVHETKLDAGDSATVSVSEEDSLSESGFSAPATHLSHDALTFWSERFNLLRL